MKKLNLFLIIVAFLLGNHFLFSQAVDKLYLSSASTGRVYDITSLSGGALPTPITIPNSSGTPSNISNLAVGYDQPGGNPSTLVFINSNTAAGSTLYKNGTAISGTTIPGVDIGGIATNNVPGPYFGNVYGFQPGTESLYPIYPSGTAIPITSTDTDWNNGTTFGTDTFFDYQNNIYMFVNNGTARYLFKISIATGVATKAISAAITGQANQTNLPTSRGIQGMAYLQGFVYIASINATNNNIEIRRINIHDGTSILSATYTSSSPANLDLATVPYYVPFTLTCSGITQSPTTPFVEGVASNGERVLNIPITNVYGPGTYTINITGANFNSSYTTTVTSTTTSISVPLVYDGGGSSGTRTISVNLNGSTTACSVNVVVEKDTDKDTIPDYLDLDDDNDGILDCAENGLDKPVNQIFELNGNASQISSNEVQLTPALNSQAGEMWSYGKIDFTKNFSMPFEAYLGNNDAGADGMAIVFQNDPAGINAIGAAGEGIGARGIQNGVVLELDTYSNTGSPALDPVADHGQIWKSSDQTAITSTVALPNLEDGVWHAVVVNWDSASQTLSYTVDGTLAGTYTGNIVTNYFGGANKVYFGFTASTGGLNNDQRVRFSSICSLPLELDTDGDGTPDHLDLDSDNDDCADAIEGGDHVTQAMLNASNAIGTNISGTLNTPAIATVDANGVPMLVNSGGLADIVGDVGQGIGDSQNIMVNSCAVPFICDSNMYMVQDSQAKLYRIDTSTNPFNFVQIGTGATYPVNATGYNPTDNFIYGINGGANVDKSLIRIDANGTFYNLGVISGLDIAMSYTSGEMDELGNYYIKLAGQNNNKLYKVDVATRTATLIQLSRNVSFIDIAYTQTDGLLWAQDTVSKKLVSINPTNGLVTDLPFVNTLNNYGAWFGSGTGQIYASSNDGTAFVEFNKTTGEAMFISTTQPSTNNDGAHCPTAPIKFDLYCSKLPVTNAGTQLPSNHGITALGRAGADNSNWPMVRQSAWTVLEAKTKGFVVNRVANPATDIANPVEGMMVFDTTAQCLKIYNGTVWSCYSTPACP